MDITIILLIIFASGFVVVIALLKLSQYADAVPKKTQEETVERKFIPNIPTPVTNTENKSEVKSKEDISVSETQKQFKIMVNDIFENSIQYMKGKCIGAEDVDNVLVYQAIKETYESLMEEKEQLILISGFTDKEFDMYLKLVRDQKIVNYIKLNK